MIKQSILLAAFISVLFLSQACNSPTDVSESNDTGEFYTPLEVGILKQYLSYSDNSYQNSKISGIAIREDGQQVFIKESSSSLIPNSSIHTSFNFIRGGYLYSTSLVKRDGEDTPFNETRIAKASPKDGDSWSIYDSGATIFTVFHVGEMITPAGIFQDVFNYQFLDPITSDTTNVYYTKGIGHIGSSTQLSKMLVNYVKIGDREFGKQVPVALLP